MFKTISLLFIILLAGCSSTSTTKYKYNQKVCVNREFYGTICGEVVDYFKSFFLLGRTEYYRINVYGQFDFWAEEADIVEE